MIGYMLLHVTNVKCIGPHTLRVWFDDDAVKDVDLTDELWGEVFDPLRDPDFFRQVSLNQETGTVEWPNGRISRPPYLHEKGVTVAG